jgi:Zn ribbon nucleic-acid-binding protein
VYQRFFCPQCGYAIRQFDVDVGENGYRMEAVCPKCQVRVLGGANLPMLIGDEVGLA